MGKRQKAREREREMRKEKAKGGKRPFSSESKENVSNLMETSCIRGEREMSKEKSKGGKRPFSSESRENVLNLMETTCIRDRGVGFVYAITALYMARKASVDMVVIDRCNESFKHWEYFQTQLLAWTYSFQFEPGSYLYVLFHNLVGSPAAFSLFTWLQQEKLGVLYGVRLLLGILSVVTEATLVVALSRKFGRQLGTYTLSMLCMSGGSFLASTSFLPSSFSMYALSLSSAFYLLDMPTMALAVAAVGTTLGWPFLILTFLPVVVHSFIRNKEHAFLGGFIMTFVFMVLSLRFNLYFYEKWTSSIDDLLFYHVVEGGVDTSYGIEGLFYYFKNGFERFNYGYIFAWLFLVILPVTRNKYVPQLLVVVSPMYILTAYMSLQPHKEERFLYSVYPLVCVAASAVIDSFPDLVRNKFMLNDNSFRVTIAKLARPWINGIVLCCFYLHMRSLTDGYSTVEICKELGH